METMKWDVIHESLFVIFCFFLKKNLLTNKKKDTFDAVETMISIRYVKKRTPINKT
jgi:hypothetical protein